MITFMQRVFGSYVPVTITQDDGTITPIPGMAGVDWEYVGSVLIFAIVLYSLFRFLGSVLK